MLGYCFMLLMYAYVAYLWLCLRGWWSRILAGSVAGFSILALNDSNRRRTLALYLLARLAQVLKMNPWSGFWTIWYRCINIFSFLKIICICKANTYLYISALIILQNLRTSFTSGEVIGDTEILCCFPFLVHRY